MKALQLGPGFEIPAEAVTQTFALLGKRGVGKTHTMAVLVEEMHAANLQTVVVDPIGVWWGLRAAADGGPGLPILVMGGDHGDVPLEATAGELVADLVVDEQLSVVLDLGRFRKGEQTRFMTDFAERLYHRNRSPLHLVLDEADAFAPQKPMPGEQRLLGAIEDLVRRGRARGIGVSLATQRAAVLNKNVLTQIEVLVALRMIAPQDRAAIDAWIQVHGTAEQRAELMASLASLPIGTAWFWSPGWLDVFQRVEVRRRRTFDSSATPEVGKAAAAPRSLAPVDIEGIRARIAGTLERAKATDPKELRKRIAALEHELAQPRPVAPPVETCVEVPVLTREQLGALLGLIEQLEDAATTVQKARNNIDVCKAIVEKLQAAPAAPVTNREKGGRPTAPTPAPAEGPTPAALPMSSLPRGERAILTALAQYPAGRTKIQVALLTGYAHSGGGFSNYISALRARGWIEGHGDQLVITAAGRRGLGTYQPLPTGRALLEDAATTVQKARNNIDVCKAIVEKLQAAPAAPVTNREKGGRPTAPTPAPAEGPTPAALPMSSLPRGERAILTALAQYPAGRTKIQVALLTGYAHSGGGFSNYISALRARGWIEGHGDQLVITAAGRRGLGTYQPLPTGRALLEHWCGQLGKAEQLILRELVSVHPSAVDKARLGERTGYQPDGGGFNNALSRLRTLELIERSSGGLRASDDLANHVQ